MKILTNEVLNIAICEWRGWTNNFEGHPDHWLSPDKETYRAASSQLPSHVDPSRIESLGNMHAAIASQPQGFQDHFATQLSRRAGNKGVRVHQRLARDWAEIALELRVIKPEVFE